MHSEPLTAVAAIDILHLLLLLLLLLLLNSTAGVSSLPSALICRVEMSDSTIMMASAPRPAQHSSSSSSTGQHKTAQRFSHVQDE
jgi:hypothetical protein